MYEAWGQYSIFRKTVSISSVTERERRPVSTIEIAPTAISATANFGNLFGGKYSFIGSSGAK